MTSQEITGKISGKYESGKRGVSTVSTGNGDAGGVSYGVHQLSSKAGTVQAFLKSSFGAPYRARFGDLLPGTKAFTDVYKSIAFEKPAEFETAQFQYIASTHYAPQAKKLLSNGIEVDSRSVAVRECVFSVSVQYGPNTSLIVNALGAKFKGTDLDFINKVQNYRRDTVKTYFKSSSKAVQDSVALRADNERTDLLALLKTTTALAK